MTLHPTISDEGLDNMPILAQDSEPYRPMSHPGLNGSGSESEDDRILREAYNSIELANHDRQVLLEEQDREELLIANHPIGQRSLFGRAKDNSWGTDHIQKRNFLETVIDKLPPCLPLTADRL